MVRGYPIRPWLHPRSTDFCANANLKGTNGVAAQSSCYLTYFTTTTGPTRPGTVTVGPPNGSQNVGTNAYIRLAFSKPADRTTVNSTNVQSPSAATAIPGSWTYNYSSSNIWWAPTSTRSNPLPPRAPIQVAGQHPARLRGQRIQRAHQCSSPPRRSPTTPLRPPRSTSAADTTGIATNASFTCHYSEPMDPSSITPRGTFVYSYVDQRGCSSDLQHRPGHDVGDHDAVSPLFTNTEYYYDAGTPST